MSRVYCRGLVVLVVGFSYELVSGVMEDMVPVKPIEVVK